MLLANLIPPWAKWAALAAVVAGIVWLGWTVEGWRADAAKLAGVERQLDAERKQRAADQRAAATYAQQAAEARAAEAALQAAVAAVPKERLIYVPKPGACPGLSDDFVRHYNAAVTGRAD